MVRGDRGCRVGGDGRRGRGRRGGRRRRFRRLGGQLGRAAGAPLLGRIRHRGRRVAGHGLRDAVAAGEFGSQVEHLHGRRRVIVRGVMHHCRLHLDRAGAQVGGHAVQGGFTPQTVLRHDLVELLELPQAGEIAGAFELLGPWEGEATGACEGGILPEFLMDELRLGRFAGERDTEEGLEEGEETLRRSSGEAGRSDARMKRFRADGERRPGARRRLVQNGRVFVELALKPWFAAYPLTSGCGWSRVVRPSSYLSALHDSQSHDSGAVRTGGLP